MSAKPFDAGLVIDRLQALLVEPGTLRKVGGAADYAQIRSLGDFPVPSAFVLLGKESALQTQTGISRPGQQHPLAQVVQVGLGVVMAFRNHRGLQGDELREALRDGVGAVRNVLLGWTPPVSGGRQLQLIGGDLEDYSTSVAVWADRYLTQHVIQPEIPA